MKKVVLFFFIFVFVFFNLDAYAVTEETEKLKQTAFFDVQTDIDDQKQMTREELIYYITRLYEVLTNTVIIPDEYLFFRDTKNEWALKAATIGVSQGVGDGLFGAAEYVTREQLAVLIIRVLEKCGAPLLTYDGQVYHDSEAISDWAQKATYLCKGNKIMTGTGDNKFSPQDLVTFEQAFIIVSRILDQFYFNPGKPVPVLTYHHLSEDVSSKSVVTKEKFHSDMVTLQEAGYQAILLSELTQYLLGNGTLPEKPILITFDDGYLSNYKEAYPILLETGMKMNIALVGWSVGKTTFIDKEIPIIPHFDWTQAQEMIESSLVELYSHTFDLHSPQGYSYGYGEQCGAGVGAYVDEEVQGYKERLSRDFVKMNDLFAEFLGSEPDFIMYPYGIVTQEAEQVRVETGYLGSFTTLSGVRIFRTLDDLSKIPRLNIPNDLSGEALILAIQNLEYQ